jgi:uncharacterized protein YjbI with pentapeptide repeats
MQRSNDNDILESWCKALKILRSGGLLCPSSLNLPTPLNLSGLQVSTLKSHMRADRNSADFEQASVSLEFRGARLRNVDFSEAQLSSSEWLDCTFESVCFDRAALCQSRFFGCQFNSCTFTSANLQNCSFSMGHKGAETSLVASTFDRTDFRGASCSRPVFRSILFRNCALDDFVFDGALCDKVVFLGNFGELTFRGLPKDGERNQLRIDLSQASVTWLNADYGIDLRPVILPLDGSCLVLTNRLRTIETLCVRLPLEAGETGKKVAGALKALFSENSISALESAQDSVLVSKAMIADFADTEDTHVVAAIFDRIRSIAKSDGALVL